jgi:protein phosphatase
MLRGKIQSFGLSDVGKLREHNEDTIGIDNDIGLFILADGMGGYNAGEVASGLAVKTIMSLVKEAYEYQNLSLGDKESNLSRPSIVLRDAISRANKIIYQTAQNQPNYEGMGTTVVACLFRDNHVSVAHVGDSRLYIFRDQKLDQVTLDHSLLQELMDRGFYDEDESLYAASKNYVTRALGIDNQVDIEIHEYPVSPVDRFLLCSDGLSDMVDNEAIRTAMNNSDSSLEHITKELIQLSNQNGGRDNISVILTDIIEPFPAKKSLLNRLIHWLN